MSEKILFKTVLLKGSTGDTIESIEKTATSGATDTYTIALNSGDTYTFDVTNGLSIASIEKTATVDLVDTYTITLTDNETTFTFDVTNGKDGEVNNVDQAFDASSSYAIANSVVTNAINNIWDTIYPVGTIYMSVNSTNPGSIFGGTWVAWGSGRVPVGVDTSDTDFDTVEETGGEKTHTLTTSEIPSHAGHVTFNGNQTILTSQAGYSASSRPYTYYAGNEIVPNTESLGGGGSHNNVQPYITCYMWKRTA